MSDLQEVLPNLDTRDYTHLFHSLEKNDIAVADLITLDPIEIARRCPLPATDVQKLVLDVTKALQDDLQEKLKQDWDIGGPAGATATAAESLDGAASSIAGPSLKTLDEKIDRALGGGIVPGHIVEVVGESAVGKTQFVLGLLLSVQLPPPHGLGRDAIYVSTEAPLSTNRLEQILKSHPAYEALEPQDRPTLDHVHAISTNDLEAQEHILRFQLPVAVQRFNVGLVVLDSVAANFRAEHETRTPAGLAERATELGKLGSMLRRVAVEHNAVVVVTNQVSDRFDELKNILRSSSPASSSPAISGPGLPSASAELRREAQSLDHQQCFFTGWGDDSEERRSQFKNPALGLAWANQISTRLVLKMESERLEYSGGNIWRDKKKSRTFRVVFAPWTSPTTAAIPYEIDMQGIVSVSENRRLEELDLPVNEEHAALLKEEFWATDDDEEFP
ncbi:DNA repair protein rhp57 [Elasticomyces elasticus]|uniref:DNA repair protein rhp57 n=1 Tax=Exophiala sideris TaxID=1016849 RepID=A0ABR0JGE6_9EURO|nr:DNA repair protein rhp57 [Elasticomyces elasticus]KAK5033256.1 DNA repair protein rhp57 [Exophiala sideris]KAK5042247.1 DNA repair protein rhp57 [Exophiala sideris]KAK5063800.1 DNA repair protein rhp57 [Exophiala sideris]KAK5185515.1 DNA repair protein rhp57 [Eurotiomycetes sp. CCFEE 6388]